MPVQSSGQPKTYIPAMGIVRAPAGERYVVLDPKGFGKPFQELFDQTDASAVDIYLLRSANNFNNPFENAFDELREYLGHPFGLITRDIMMKGTKKVNRGRVHTEYVKHSGIAGLEKHAFAYSPKGGLYVPTSDGLFWPDTVIPFETVPFNKMSEARKAYKKHGHDPKMISGYYTPDFKLNSEMFVGVYFLPNFVDRGRFSVLADWLPGYSGFERVASLPAYGQPNIVLAAKPKK